MEEKVGIHERLAAAFHSRDLSLSANKRRDVDHLIALGLAGRDSPNRAAAGALTRLQLSASQSDYKRARVACGSIAKRLALKNNWSLSAQNLTQVGDLALAHHVFPTCPHCNGLKYVKHETSSHLSGVLCKFCCGTGKRLIQQKWQSHIRDVMAALENINVVTGRAVARLLR